ncbi:MAG: hypothetical protein IH897_15430 [Planctomycetes bacterium]|nr:hypothetical protein [Planctomycetota bacterium]
MQAIDAMDRRFQIDALKMKSDSLVKLGVSAETSDEHFAIAQTGKDLLDEAFTKDQFELATVIGKTALNPARKLSGEFSYRKVGP